MGVTRISIRERRIRVLKRKYQEFGTVKKTVLNKNDLKQELRMKNTINHLQKLTKTDREKVTGEKNYGYNGQSEVDLNNNFTNIGGRPVIPQKGYEFNCNLCEKSFAFVQHIKIHMSLEHSGCTYVLPEKSLNRPKETQKIFDNSIENHELKQNVDGRTVCLTCHKTFVNFQGAKRHFKETHLNFKRNLILGKQSDQSYGIHKLMIRKNTEDFCCQICKKICKTKSGLDSHMRWHNVWKQLEVTENGLVKCLDCDKTYSSLEGARSHCKKWHMADKNGNNFICKLCDEEYEVQYSLKEHVKNVHGRPKEFKNKKLQAIGDGRVKCLDCDKTYSSIDTARRHYKFLHMTDKNDVPFFCDECKKGFAIQGYLNRHMKKIHMSKKIFKCKICKMYLGKSNKCRHMRVVHGSTEGWMAIDVSPNKKLFKKCVIPLPPID